MSETSIAPEPLAASSDDGSAAILAIVNPPGACPLCYAERGEPYPAHHTTRICTVHDAALRFLSEARKSQQGAHA